MCLDSTSAIASEINAVEPIYEHALDNRATYSAVAPLFERAPNDVTALCSCLLWLPIMARFLVIDSSCPVLSGEALHKPRLILLLICNKC